MYVRKETIDEHFKKKKVGVGRGRAITDEQFKNKKVGLGHGQFVKKIRYSVYADSW